MLCECLLKRGILCVELMFCCDVTIEETFCSDSGAFWLSEETSGHFYRTSPERGGVMEAFVDLDCCWILASFKVFPH